MRSNQDVVQYGAMSCVLKGLVVHISTCLAVDALLEQTKVGGTWLECLGIPTECGRGSASQEVSSIYILVLLNLLLCDFVSSILSDVQVCRR